MAVARGGGTSVRRGSAQACSRRHARSSRNALGAQHARERGACWCTGGECAVRPGSTGGSIRSTRDSSACPATSKASALQRHWFYTDNFRTSIAQNEAPSQAGSWRSSACGGARASLGPPGAADDDARGLLAGQLACACAQGGPGMRRAKTAPGVADDDAHGLLPGPLGAALDRRQQLLERILGLLLRGRARARISAARGEAACTARRSKSQNLKPSIPTRRCQVRGPLSLQGAPSGPAGLPGSFVRPPGALLRARACARQTRPRTVRARIQVSNALRTIENRAATQAGCAG